MDKMMKRLENEHILGGGQGYILEITDGILTPAGDLELEVNENDIEELIMGHEDELTVDNGLRMDLNQADVSRVADLYNDNAINYFRKIQKKREKQSTLDMFFNAP
ncbi:hypothetical protein TNCV_921161 [Trichonephila clavipes]|nr:hypothetical protein TNCV_921161 [Trichonephila clavipes]